MRRSVPADRAELLAWPAERGLSGAEARERRERYGANDVVEPGAAAWREIAAQTARDPMLWFLAGTGGVYALLGELPEALTLLASAVPLIGMDAFLHRRTQASTAALRSRLADRARALRDGAFVEVPARDLVPGDLLAVRAGQPFPADGVLLDGALQVDESLLTGESQPVRKRALSVPRALALTTETWVCAGTRLLAGEGAVRVISTGAETLYGEIARSARGEPRARTPLQQAVTSLVRVLLFAALVLCAVLAVVRLRQGFGWLDALLSAATLAVAALPEEFPVILTGFLGVGVYRLARRKALVRRAVSVENIGRVTCICSDKTGTITRGELRLAHRLAGPEGDEARLLRIAALASRTQSLDPLDAAIWAAAEASHATPAAGDPLELFPFTEDRRRETAVVRAATGEILAATKGAPELVLSLCELAAAERASWAARAAELAAEGHKVIACASRELAGGWAGGEPDRGLRFEGLLAFEDPVRPEVAPAIAQCRAAGIRVVMVTGDHRATACAVAREIGLGGAEPNVLSGEELAALLARHGRVPPVDLVVRALPAQKLALVRALQDEGEIVAVTGDGVNDVPALQVADVGVAMAERGTRSAREAAAIVLLDDCFDTIVQAIAEGRQLFHDLSLAFGYLLAIHIPLVVTAALIPLAGDPLLYLPIHVVWLELVIHPSALLAFNARPGPDGIQRRRDGPGRRFFARTEWAALALSGALVTALVAFGYERALGTGAEVLHGRAMAMAALSGASAGAVAALSRLRTTAARVICAATLLSALALIQIPALAARVHVQPLHATDWSLALAGAALACLPLLWLSRSGSRSR